MRNIVSFKSFETIIGTNFPAVILLYRVAYIALDFFRYFVGDYHKDVIHLSIYLFSSLDTTSHLCIVVPIRSDESSCYRSISEGNRSEFPSAPAYNASRVFSRATRGTIEESASLKLESLFSTDTSLILKTRRSPNEVIIQSWLPQLCCFAERQTSDLR